MIWLIRSIDARAAKGLLLGFRSYLIVGKVHFFQKARAARSALRKEAHIAVMLMNEICVQNQ